MPETYFEASLREASHSWRALRRRRARPPVPIPTGKEPAQARIATFQTALEQAEQQFRAASTIAYDSRALNLYYGLQQAGRAIAATSPQLDNTDYTLNGHGLEITPKLGSAPVVDIGSMRLRTSPRPPQASFNRISRLLGSDVPESFTLKQMWPSLVEPIYARNASLGDAAHPPLSVYLPQYNAPMAPAAHQSASPELPLALRESASWPNVEDYLARYPALDGCTNPAWPATRHTQWTLWWDLDGEQERHVLDDRLILYRGQRMAFPTIAADRTTAVHPLMAWWSVLFALSMLTRYAPSDWTRLTDIDRTPQATAIEFVLDRAVDAIPDLVDEAIAAVSSNASPSGSIGA